jgi:hypothetical protein
VYPTADCRQWTILHEEKDRTMDTLQQLTSSLVQKLGAALPSVIGALLVLIIGYVLAGLLRRAVAALLGKSTFVQKLGGDGEKKVPVNELVSQLVYYLVMLYVLIVALEVLGISNVLDPIKQMFAGFLAAVPRIIAAALIGFIGYVLARLLSEPTKALAAPLDKYSKKLGLSESFALSKLLAQLVFLAVFLPLLVAALDALGIQSISAPATDMIQSLIAAVPMILAAAVILAVAYTIGSFVTTMLEQLLANLGADAIPGKLGVDGWFGEKSTLSKVIGKTALLFVMIAATTAALDKLGFAQVSAAVAALLVFLSQVLLGVAILALGALVAKGVHGAMTTCGCGAGLATLTRVAIIGLVLAMGLKAMGIADAIVELAFALTLGSVAVAVALSFGLGGREAAGKHLEYMLAKLRKPEQ